MNRQDIIRYYSRKDVQKAIIECAQQREVGVRFIDRFSKRPDVLLNPGDISALAKQGATSFHLSEERWNDPLLLRPGMNKKELDSNRCGWDLLIDIDTELWDIAKHTAYFVVEALKFYNIKSISVKFSGNKGFHIGVPFEAFPEEVNGRNIKDWFPEGLRVIAAYIQNMIKDFLASKILGSETLNQLALRVNKKPEDLIVNGKFDPFKVVEIDTVLISSRHLFRAPYSLHEKSRLVSVPIKPDTILSFEKELAKPENVKADILFLDRTNVRKNEAKELLIQAFDWYAKFNKKSYNETENVQKNRFELPATAIDETYFPPCIKKMLNGKLEDGKKRTLFVLINFLQHMGWSWEAIESRLRAWNKTNIEPLHENYLTGQLRYAQKNKNNLLPPNCANNNYYKDLGFCANIEPLCNKIKNPANYSMIAFKNRTKKKKS